jgi:hypothetical protein
VFRGTAVVRAGVLTRQQLRSGAWRRLRQDVYADALLAVDHLLHVRGVGLVAPPEGVFGGLSAVALRGAEGFATALDPVEVVMPPSTRWQPGAAASMYAMRRWTATWSRAGTGCVAPLACAPLST